jgi:hypothetical protein
MPLKWCNLNGTCIKFLLFIMTESMPISMRRALCFGVPYSFLGTS